jgi:3-oxoacyl-[acyl-carrier protein] reductase
MDLRTALITGAAQGIGAETASVLAERGWRIIIADLQSDIAEVSAADLTARFPVPGGHLGLGVDVASEQSVADLYVAVSQVTSSLQGLVNGAGILVRGAAETFDTLQWHRQIEIHLTGAFLLSRGAFPLLTAAPGGSIVNIASVGSTFGLPGRIAYSTAKSGILGFTRTLAAEWGGRGVRVNAVAPGYVATEMVQSGLRSGSLNQDKLFSRTPLGRLAEPREIATSIAFLLSEDASFVHGAVLNVDGGLTIDGTF